MKHNSVLALFEQAADRFRERTAIDCAEKKITYGELEARANNLANFLLASGASKGGIVAILAEDIGEVLIAMIGTLKAGCAFAPIDPALPEKRIETMLSEVPPDWIVAERRFLFKAGELLISCPAGTDARLNTKMLCIDDGAFPHDERDANFNPARPDVVLGADDMCYIYFTSGSTGKPKGIAGRRKGLAHFIQWEIKTFGIDENTRVSQLTTPSFDPFLRDVFVPLCAGGTVCVPDSLETCLDPHRLIRWIDSQRINLIHCVPSLFRLMINTGLEARQFSVLQYILLAGEALLVSDVKRWMDVFDTRIQLVNLLGPSETTLAKFCYLVQPADVERRSIPIGKPIRGAAAVIVNERGKPSPKGTVGEIYIRTPYRSLGYYNQPELTHEVFIPNPFNNDPNDIVYKTGDLGRVLPDGNFEFLGRKDFQVKIRGLRIELTAIESLLRGHDAISDVVVTARDDTIGTKYLCAYLVLGEPQDERDLTAYLSSHLPAYMVPSAYVVMDKLPRSLNGKVNRRALPAPEQFHIGDEDTFVEPRTPVEQKVAAIWAQVLNVQRIGVHDNFFRSGGHSLLATQVLSRVREAFEAEVPLRAFFETPTVAGIAAYIDAHQHAAESQRIPPLVHASREKPLQLSFAQQRLWFLNQLEGPSSTYSIQQAVRLSGALDVATLERAINEIVQRHEVLRTTFRTVDGQPVQAIAPSLTISLHHIDLRHSSGQAQEAAAQQFLIEDGHRPFDLEHGPLLRVTLLELAEAYILLFTMHHIIADVWSLGVLGGELTSAYKAFSNGQPTALPKLPIQYADYAHWHRSWLEGGVLQSQTAYWKKQLGNLPTLNLPTDRPRPAIQSNRGAGQRFDFPKSLTTELHELSQRENVTLFMTLTAAFNVLLHWYTGQNDIVVGTDVANRNRTELEPLIGFFVNQLVLRTNLSSNPTFSEVLGRIKTVTLGAYGNQDMPFDKLVEALNPKRDTSRTPLFQVKLVLQNVPMPTAEVEGLTYHPLDLEDATAKFDLLMNMSETEVGLRGNLQYNTDLFNRSTIEKLLRYFEMVLKAVVPQPDARLEVFINTLNDAAREQQEVEEQQLQRVGRQKLKQLGKRKAARRAARKRP